MNEITPILVLHNISSFMVIIMCWWTAHQYARARPPGKLIALALGVLGMTVLITSVGRNTGVAPEVFIAASKVSLWVFLVGLAIRNHRMGKDDKRYRDEVDPAEWRHRALNAEQALDALARAVLGKDDVTSVRMASSCRNKQIQH